MKSKFIVGLDIGSLSIKAVLAELKGDGSLVLHYATKSPAEGMRKGMVDDLGAVTRSVNAVLADMRQIHKNATKHIYLGIGTPNVRVQVSRGIVAVSRADFEIYDDDITRAIVAAESVKLPANRAVIHTITDEFVVDDVADIKDPLGMTGHRLEAKAMIIDVFAPAVKNITRAVEVAGGSIEGLIYEPIAAARAVFSKNQRELGTVLVDVGFSTTAISVYQEYKLLHTNIIPFGAGHVTNDLTVGLKISVEAAESVKLAYGAAFAKDIPIRETVDITKFEPHARGAIGRRYIADIVEVRLAEILEFINNDLKAMNKAGQLPGGVVLTGGGAKTPGLTDLVRQEMKLPARVGIPDLSQFQIPHPELAASVEDPEYACAVGLALWGVDKSRESRGPKTNVFGWLKKVLGYIVP